MSSFNWFNRELSESSSPPDESSPPSTAPETPAQEGSGTAPANADDYLIWAKAAYKNIQKRQVETAPTSEEPAAEPSEELPVEATEVAAAIPETVDPLTPPIEVNPDGVAVDLAIAPDAAIFSEPVDSQPKTVSLPAAEPTEVAPVAGEDAAPLPLWARAEAERIERLERLKAEAIEEPEPEPVLASVAIDAEAELDENFLWSARVLAAQGRRADQVVLEEITWLKRLRQGLDKTRRSLINQLRSIVGQGPLNQEAVMEIESLLLQADVGVKATDFIIESLQTKLRQETLPPEEAIAYLKQLLRQMLDNPGGKPINPTFAPEKDTLNIWLMTGVNGAGKTTTIGKIAHLAQKSGYRCLIGAADTFRAAAVEQVKIWAKRSNVEVISNPGQNTDPAAVVFDAISAAQARGTELLLIDTAGRLQNKKNLMDELAKVRRIIDKKAPNAHVESLLVLDATLGQNGLRQAEVFSEAAQLSGVILTKLDGTARGGVALAVVQQLGLPIRFIGAGEGVEDLRPFSSYEFVEALLSG